MFFEGANLNIYEIPIFIIGIEVIIIFCFIFYTKNKKRGN